MGQRACTATESVTCPPITEQPKEALPTWAWAGEFFQLLIRRLSTPCNSVRAPYMPAMIAQPHTSPQMLHDDGAQFRARIDKVDGGVFRACCHVVLDRLSNVFVEQPEYEMCVSEDAARLWVHNMASRRGFPLIHWERVDQV